MNIPEPAVKTINVDSLPSKEKLRQKIEDGFKGRKNKISQKLPEGTAKNLIGFVNIRRHEPAGVYKDPETGETFLTGDSTPVQMVSTVRSKRTGAWKHGKKR